MTYTTADLKRVMFIDIETTGLEKNRQVLEVFATFPFQTELEDYHWVTSSPTAVGMCNSFVRTMHEKNGLVDEIFELFQEEQLTALRLNPSNPLTALDSLDENVDELRESFSEFLSDAHAELGGKIIWAGNSVHFDKYTLEAFVPVEKYSDHRLLDVSSLKMVLGLTGQEFSLPEESGVAHRAKFDVESSIAEFKSLLSALDLTIEDPED